MIIFLKYEQNVDMDYRGGADAQHLYQFCTKSYNAVVVLVGKNDFNRAPARRFTQFYELFQNDMRNYQII